MHESRVENIEKPFYLTLHSTHYCDLWYTTFVNFRQARRRCYDVCDYPTLQYVQRFSSSS